MSPDIVDGKGKFVRFTFLGCRFFIIYTRTTLNYMNKYCYILNIDDGFYRLKKDSERRVMLVRVLETERSRICDHWMEIYLNDLPNNKETFITMVTTMINIFYVLDNRM